MVVLLMICHQYQSITDIEDSVAAFLADNPSSERYRLHDERLSGSISLGLSGQARCGILWMILFLDAVALQNRMESPSASSLEIS
jgi:hypothetical protein